MNRMTWTWVEATRKTAVVTALLFAALTGIGALMRVPLFPVPVTMQLFFVLLAGLVLGPVWGPISQLTYLVMGIAGAPFFAAWPHAGPAVLFGPTAGYLWGFIGAALVTGRLAATPGCKQAEGRRLHLRLLMAALAGVTVCYVMGTSWLAAWLGAHGSDSSMAFRLGVQPFIVADLCKAILAAGAAMLMQRRPGADTEERLT